MIDLSTCVSGQKVRFANGKTGEVLAGTEWSRHRIRADNNGWWWCTSDGIPCNHTWSPGWEIVEILPLEVPEEKPMIDLFPCIPGQKVKYRNGAIGTYAGFGSEDFGQFLTKTIYNNPQSHTRSGLISTGGYHPYDVVEILPLEIEQPMTTPQEMDYKRAYIEIANIISVAFPECEVCTVDMATLLIHENRTLRMALGLPSYEQVSNAIYRDEEMA